MDAHDGGKTVTLDLPMGHVGVHAPGGTILPLQQPALVTADVRASALTLLVALPYLQPLPSLATSSTLKHSNKVAEQLGPAENANVKHHAHQNSAQWTPHKQQQQQLQQPRQSSLESQQGPAPLQQRSMLTQQAVEEQADGVCGVSEPGRATACGSIYMDDGDQLQVCQ